MMKRERKERAMSGARADVQDVADYFILRSDLEAGDLLSHLKLQKLLYYAQGWHLALFGEPLFDPPLEAWQHGPVCPTVWKRFKDKGWNPIMPAEARGYPDKSLDSETVNFLSEIWDVYGQFSARRLEEMTHEETPWKEPFANGDRRIPIDLLKAYFTSHAKA